jgi:hypothetical protein
MILKGIEMMSHINLSWNLMTVKGNETILPIIIILDCNNFSAENSLILFQFTNLLLLFYCLNKKIY